MSQLKFPHIYHCINEITEIPLEEWTVVEPYLISKNYKKGQLIEKVGRQAKNIYILLSGSVRFFYLTDDGKDFNHTFKFENDIFAAYASIISNTPSTYSIETLEDSTIISLNYSILQQNFEKYHSWEKLGRLIAESHYLTKENREYHFLITSAEQRYKTLVLTNKNLSTRIPQYHLATYLGINPSSLNRIIKNLKE